MNKNFHKEGKMKILTSIRVKNYRSILDEKIELSNMLAFIGANESGKSNVLKALNHLSRERQYSNFKLKELNLSVAHSINNLIEIEYEVILKEYLIPNLSLNIPSLIERTVFIKKKGYANDEVVWEIELEIPSKVGNLVLISGNKSIFRNHLKSAGFNKSRIDNLLKNKYFVSSAETNLSKNPFHSLKNENIIKVLDEKEKHAKLKELVLNEVLENIQVYFWKYNEVNYLKESIVLEDFCKTPKGNESVFGIFKIAKDEGAFNFKLNSDNLTKHLLDSTSTLRSNLLKEIAKSFNKIFKKSWSTYFGTSKLELILGYEGNNLSVRLNDGRECPPEYRSGGLKWFLTFLINFQSKQKDLSNYILIMDEPGGLLHPKGQKDALNFLLKLTEKNQVFYSTHQTFLLDKNNPQNVRILDRKEKDRRNDFWPTRIYGIKDNTKHILQDSLLREALGFTLSDISPINDNNILVEGTFDRNILQFCNEQFKIIDFNNCSFISSGRASAIRYQAAHYISNGLNVICLYDYDDTGRQAFDNNSEVKKENKFLISSTKGETIEDILPIKIFTNAFNVLSSKAEYKTYFKHGPFNIQKPLIRKTFDISLKGNISKESKLELKQDLEKLMFDQLQQNFNKDELSNIEKLLLELKNRLN